MSTPAYVVIAWTGTILLPLQPTAQIYGTNACGIVIFVLVYKSSVLVGLYGRSANVFRDGYTFRTLLCNAISNENKKKTSNSTDFPRLYCEFH